MQGLQGDKLGVKYRKLRNVIALAFFLAAAVVAVNSAVKLMFPLKYKQYVYKYSAEHGIDPYLIFAIIKAESSFNPWATSVKDAKGLMQITEKTGIWGAQSLKIKNFSADSLYDPETNIRIGCWYISMLMKEFDNNTDLVIAAYNGGSGNVSGWLKDRNYSRSGNSLEKIPFKETDRFLKKVKNYYSIYKSLYKNFCQDM